MTLTYTMEKIQAAFDTNEACVVRKSTSQLTSPKWSILSPMTISQHWNKMYMKMQLECCERVMTTATISVYLQSGEIQGETWKAYVASWTAISSMQGQETRTLS